MPGRAFLHLQIARPGDDDECPFSSNFHSGYKRDLTHSSPNFHTSELSKNQGFEKDLKARSSPSQEIEGEDSPPSIPPIGSSSSKFYPCFALFILYLICFDLNLYGIHRLYRWWRRFEADIAMLRGDLFYQCSKFYPPIGRIFEGYGIHRWWSCMESIDWSLNLCYLYLCVGFVGYWAFIIQLFSYQFDTSCSNYCRWEMLD